MMTTSKYKMIVGKNGREIWFKDGKIVSKKDVPAEEIEKDADKYQEEVNEQVVKENKMTGCVSCGAPADTKRVAMVDGEMVDILLCGSCYYTTTLGEAVGKYKKAKGG
jgi:hypothetical protein